MSPGHTAADSVDKYLQLAGVGRDPIKGLIQGLIQGPIQGPMFRFVAIQFERKAVAKLRDQPIFRDPSSR